MDPVTGVTILLSQGMTSNVLIIGHVRSRIAWVRIVGPISNLFVVVVYIPHKGRKKAPTATDTIQELKTLLLTTAKSYCIILGGDMNYPLQRHVK